jgi:hypothetical protein
MPLPWVILTATDMEEKALLSAAVGLSVTAPVTYYAGVSTTQPTKPGAINEISGSGYARTSPGRLSIPTTLRRSLPPGWQHRSVT